MRPTSASNLPSNIVAKIEKLNLVLKTDMHRPWTFRDAFTRFAANPVNALRPETERRHILKNISFTVQKSERIGLLGVNGTGKTTLCRCISGIYGTSSGKISLNGKVRAVFDTTAGILPELTGRENARLLSYFIYPELVGEHDALLEEVIKFSELGKYADVPFKFYSNGMQARLFLSLVSCRPVDLIILDEVFEGADAFFREKISARVQSMIEQSGAAIFVSHSPEQMKRVCNRLIVLHLGEIVYDGNVEGGLEYYGRLKPTS